MPHLIDLGNSASEENYPVDAKRKGIEGYVVVNATLDAEVNVTFVQIVSEYPADEEYGFAESAARMAKTMRFSNPKHQTTQVKFKVQFALKDGQHPPANTPQ
jgi:TonB family protein